MSAGIMPHTNRSFGLYSLARRYPVAWFVLMAFVGVFLAIEFGPKPAKAVSTSDCWWYGLNGDGAAWYVSGRPHHYTDAPAICEDSGNGVGCRAILVKCLAKWNPTQGKYVPIHLICTPLNPACGTVITPGATTYDLDDITTRAKNGPGTYWQFTDLRYGNCNDPLNWGDLISSGEIVYTL